MKKGTVKNGLTQKKVSVLFPFPAKMMYSYISPQSRLMVTKLWKKVRK